MAKVQFKGIDAYQLTFKQLGNPKVIEGMCKYGVYPAAGMAVEELKKAVPYDNGDLHDSAAISDMKTENGVTFARVTFTGYDRKGVPNLLKARVLESGRSSPTGKIAKNPFMRRVKERIRKQAESLMQGALNDYIDKNIKK